MSPIVCNNELIYRLLIDSLNFRDECLLINFEVSLHKQIESRETLSIFDICYMFLLRTKYNNRCKKPNASDDILLSITFKAFLTKLGTDKAKEIQNKCKDTLKGGRT